MVVQRYHTSVRNFKDTERSALQTLHKVSAKAREQNYWEGGSTHGWVGYYENHIESDRSCLNEWHAMDDLESKRPPSPDSVRTKPTEREETERVIRMTLKEIMMSVDLDEVTSKVIRSRLEEELDMDLGEYKSFIDQEMLVILGQMDAPTEIFDHVYLGSEWNASNYDELRKNGYDQYRFKRIDPSKLEESILLVGHILNVTREIDNFFPGAFDYLNVRVYDDEKTDLLKHWDDTFKYITKAKDKGSKVLVHCKMGVSRSASVVIAYAMKAYNWDFCTALKHVKEKRSCIKPNTSFLSQLETYQGILDAMKNKEKLQRSKSETNLQSPATNRKNEKILTGSEPTPVIQALNKSNDLNGKVSGKELKRLGVRPKSWSPDHVTSKNLTEMIKNSPLSISLEDVSQKSSSKESVKCHNPQNLARHVLMPCDNGESYSVSPNQIVHLPGHDDVLSLHQMFNSMTKDNNCSCGKEKDNKQETWDPGEQVAANSCNDDKSEVCDSITDNNSTVWTCCALVKTENAVPVSCNNNSLEKVKVPEKSDPFSNQLDRVFDWEEKKQQRVSTVVQSEIPDDKSTRECPSRQNSWSSYDSAVVLGNFQPETSELSRHSSWGSGDTRTLPSRNSSWGSYDMRRRDPVHYTNEKGEILMHSNSELYGIFPYDKEDIPWHPGTVKRSKLKIEEGSRKPSSNDSLTGSCVSLIKTPSSETLLTTDVVEAINPIFATSSAISDKIDIPIENCKESTLSRLSISAPEPSSMELITHEKQNTLSRSASNVSSMRKDGSNAVVNTTQVSSVKQHRTFLENLQNAQDFQMNKKPEVPDASGSGKVKNLKKEFEAKSSTNDEIQDSGKSLKTRVNSLPSSPVSVHVTKDNNNKKDDNKVASDDVNFKNLIGIFENKEESFVNRRQKFTDVKSPPSKRNARHSCIEISVEKSPQILINNKKSSLGEKSERPPPIPIVKAPSACLVAATVITAAKKKQQQYGKSHPLAKLNIKPRHNNPVYNTM